MFHYEGLSLHEVGGMLGVSAEAVESLLARARRSMRAALAAEWKSMQEESRSDA
jgi:RNA polymerase sigma-70 factor (ECF subfamily)